MEQKAFILSEDVRKKWSLFWLSLRDEIIRVFSRLSKLWEMMCSLVSAKSLWLVVTDVRVGSVGGRGGRCASFLRMVSLVE